MNITLGRKHCGATASKDLNGYWHGCSIDTESGYAYGPWEDWVFLAKEILRFEESFAKLTGAIQEDTG